jgi:hypothetical protein
MDPLTTHEIPPDWDTTPIDGESHGSSGIETAGRPEAFVLFERGAIESRIVHDQERVERRREERELEALAQRYSRYAQVSPSPLTFEQYVEVIKSLNE